MHICHGGIDCTACTFSTPTAPGRGHPSHLNRVFAEGCARLEISRPRILTHPPSILFLFFIPGGVQRPQLNLAGNLNQARPVADWKGRLSPAFVAMRRQPRAMFSLCARVDYRWSMIVRSPIDSLVYFCPGESSCHPAII